MRLKIWSRGTGSTVPSRVSLLILHTQAEPLYCTAIGELDSVLDTARSSGAQIRLSLRVRFLRRLQFFSLASRNDRFKKTKKHRRRLRWPRGLACSLQYLHKAIVVTPAQLLVHSRQRDDCCTTSVAKGTRAMKRYFNCSSIFPMQYLRMAQEGTYYISKPQRFPSCTQGAIESQQQSAASLCT